jgi:hypothetical protein
MKKLADEKQFHLDGLELRVKDQAGKLIEAETLSAIAKQLVWFGHDIRNPCNLSPATSTMAKTDLSEMPEVKRKKA